MCVCVVCVCSAQLLSRVQLFVTPWTVARQAPLSMGVSRQKYWNGMPFPPPRHLPNPESNLCLLQFLHCRQILYHWVTWKDLIMYVHSANTTIYIINLIPLIPKYYHDATWASTTWASQVVLVVNNPPANAGDIRDMGSIPGSGRSPGGRHGNPLQYSYLENPRDRGAWTATVQRIMQSRAWLKQLSTHARTPAPWWISIEYLINANITCLLTLSMYLW